MQQEAIGEDEKQGIPGPVLHQPLSCSIFWKKGVFCQKMNGPPVCPARKTENAPTWRSPSPVFWTPKSGFFGYFLSPSASYFSHPSHTPH